MYIYVCVWVLGRRGGATCAPSSRWNEGANGLSKQKNKWPLKQPLRTQMIFYEKKKKK